MSVKRIQTVSEKALGRIQSELFDLGAEMACEPEKLPDYLNLISTKQCDDLTEEMDAWLEHLEPLTSFILPTGMALNHIYIRRGQSLADSEKTWSN